MHNNKESMFFIGKLMINANHCFFRPFIKMMNLRKILVPILFVVMGMCGYAQTPQRIVSLAPSLTKMIYLLGAQHQLVGCTSYCEDAIKEHKTVVASAIDVNVEKVFLLKPDLVVASTLTKPATIEALEKVGIKVKAFPVTKSYAEICSQFMELADVTGKKTLAASIVEKQQLRLNRIKKLIPKGKKPNVFFEIGAKPLFTVIPNTFMDDYISYAGGLNIASDLKSGTISRETVLMRNPDIIVIVTMGIVGAEEKKGWENYHMINASKTGKVFIIDSDKACSPNPVNFVDIVEELVTRMYQ
jgi:ABC-type Fe3+-hydroxamate transport system substrate-binding protein